jgi:hypothetical protein
MKEHAPGWTDHNQHDPGTAILELMAYLAEGLQLYAKDPYLIATSVSRIIRALEVYEQSQRGAVNVHEHWCGVVRPVFFSGRLLTADDLRDEQEYQRKKHRRHLRTLHGFGVVEGLDVEVGAGGWTMTIGPGYAVDNSGQEVCLGGKATIAIPSNSPSPVSVVVQYAERRVEPVPVSSDGDTEPSRIEEGCKVFLSPAASGMEVEIARLVREGGGWRVDSSFLPPRLKAAGP